MLNILLYLLIIGGCAGIGIFKAYDYRERVSLLEEFIKMTRTLKTEMTYKLDPLPELLKKMGRLKKDSAHFVCSEAAQIYEERKICPLSEAWEESIKRVYMNSSLLPEDMKIMIEIGANLGISSSQSQEEFLYMHIEELKENLNDAINDSRTKGKMFTGMGFVVGITIVILII
ncbi:MAG: stage III sporulation protein AB [Eubacteriales bacterium]|nr:stage III sporulation protein AB [Eubacteriales bacterium]MDD4389462.1 stage III sporulation protein AB [Eubacteriales bacterium]